MWSPKQKSICSRVSCNIWSTSVLLVIAAIGQTLFLLVCLFTLTLWSDRSVCVPLPFRHSPICCGSSFWSALWVCGIGGFCFLGHSLWQSCTGILPQLLAHAGIFCRKKKLQWHSPCRGPLLFQGQDNIQSRLRQSVLRADQGGAKVCVQSKLRSLYVIWVF